MFLVFSSKLYIIVGKVVISAITIGTLVIASNTEVIPKLVNHNSIGLLFYPNNSIDLAAKIEWVWKHPVIERGGIHHATRIKLKI